MTSHAFDAALRRRVLDNLGTFDRRESAGGGEIRAAVAVTLVGNESGEACFIITRRVTELRSHGGQWALPGGRIDPGESAAQTALRELEEEVGLSLESSSVLGQLDDYVTRSGYVITPVLAWGGRRVELAPNPAEVAAAFLVPLAALEAPGVPRLGRIPESDRPLLSIPIEMLGTSIHAPTAALLYQLREVAIHGRDTRVDHYEQPVFAWR